MSLIADAIGDSESTKLKDHQAEMMGSESIDPIELLKRCKGEIEFSIEFSMGILDNLPGVATGRKELIDRQKELQALSSDINKAIAESNGNWRSPDEFPYDVKVLALCMDDEGCEWECQAGMTQIKPPAFVNLDCNKPIAPEYIKGWRPLAESEQ